MRNNWHKIMENEIGIFITPVVRGMEMNLLWKWIYCEEKRKNSITIETSLWHSVVVDRFKLTQILGYRYGEIQLINWLISI